MHIVLFSLHLALSMLVSVTCHVDTVACCRTPGRHVDRFRSFVTWRDTLSHVLLVTLTQSVKEGWRGTQPPRRQEQLQQLQSQGSGGGTAQQLMARCVGP